MFASAPGGLAYEKQEIEGGVFSYALAKALDGAADSNGDGRLTIGEVSRYIEATMASLASGVSHVVNRGAVINPILSNDGERQFKPFLELSGSPDLVILDRDNAPAIRRVAVIAGVSRYPSEMIALRYATNDAERVSAVLKRKGVEVNLLTNPTRSQLVQGVQQALQSVGPQDVFYFFFSGHGWQENGEANLGPADIHVSDGVPSGSLSLEELKSMLQSSRPKAAFAFFDVCRNEIRSR